MKTKILNHCMLDIFDSIFDYSYNLTKFVELKKYLMNNLIGCIRYEIKRDKIGLNLDKRA